MTGWEADTGWAMACWASIFAGDRFPAANAVHVIAQATATHTIRAREICGTEPPSSICRIRRRREPPGMAMPAMFSRAPERMTERAMSMRYSEYSRGLCPRKYDVVTGFFGQSGEMAFQPPGDRVEPEESTVQQSKPLHEGIGAAGRARAHASRWHRVARETIGASDLENYGWMEEPHSHRHGA